MPTAPWRIRTSCPLAVIATENRTWSFFWRCNLAPFKAAVLPLSKKLSPKAEEIYKMLKKDFMVDFDDAGSIGKRYRREDEIGTPLCITVDFQTIGDGEIEADNCVTVRDRDTMEQVRIPISELREYIAKKCEF